jgi:hypothetical protein
LLAESIGGTIGLPAEGKMERLNFSFYNPLPTAAPPNDDLVGKHPMDHVCC